MNLMDRYVKSPAKKLGEYSVKEALEQVNDDLPDGAYWETLCQMTGLDIGVLTEKMIAMKVLKPSEAGR